MEPSSVKRRLTCILAADAVGYSKHMSQDEEGTIRVLSAHRAVIDGIIAFHQGRIVSTAGDSVLAEFSSAVEAVRCAVEVQDALKTRNDALPDHRKMLFRVGVNLGDVVIKGDDLLGDGVNVAARLETMAEPGGICIASSVYDQITGKLDLGFQDIGEQQLKNITRPVRVYRVSGASAPIRLPTLEAPAPGPAKKPRGPALWALAGVAVLTVGALAAWQAGWVKFGSGGQNNSLISGPTAAPAAAVLPTSVASDAPAAAASDAGAMALAQAEAEVKRLRAEAQVLKAQAEVDLAKARTATQVTQKVPVKTTAAVPAVQAVKALPSPTGHPFDGLWQVDISCQRHSDGAAGYQLNFEASIKQGRFLGENGTEGKPGWLRLQGDVLPDGRAMLSATGLTADPGFSVKRVASGSAYDYPVNAMFEGKHGIGRRQKLRACVIEFNKQK